MTDAPAIKPVFTGVNKRVDVKIRNHEERSCDMNEVVLGYTKEESIEEAKRCLSCKKPFCVDGCPAHVPIHQYLAATKTGDSSGALGIILELLPLAGICGRVCPHFCEAKCIRGKKGQPLSIALIKRAASDYGTFVPPSIAPSTGKKVAVIGSGPAGLSAAYFLARSGHKCTIFEQKKSAGGMMTLCIPPYRLPRDVLKADIDRILTVGVEIKLDSPIGPNHTVTDLLDKDGFDAVFIGVGTLKAKALGIPGEDAQGVEHVIPFLESINCDGRTVIGKRVAVIGAGYSAMDAVRTSKRLGSEAMIIYRRQREQMPASADEVDEAEEEGCELHVLTNPTKVVVKDGKVVGIECLKQRLGAPDRSGRPAPEPVPGSEYVIDCDMVIQAISQDAELTCIADAKLKLSRWNTIETNEETGETSDPRIWAAGDAVTGPKTIIEAVAAAHKAAINMDIYLRK